MGRWGKTVSDAKASAVFSRFTMLTEGPSEVAAAKRLWLRVGVWETTNGEQTTPAFMVCTLSVVDVESVLDPTLEWPAKDR